MRAGKERSIFCSRPFFLRHRGARRICFRPPVKAGRGRYPGRPAARNRNLSAGPGLRSRLVIDGTRIEVRGAFQERSVDLSEVEVFRTITNAQRLVLEAEAGRRAAAPSPFRSV